MDNDRQQCADQILESIDYGHLSREEIERRLNQIIDNELSGPIDADYDATKVAQCNSLLWQLQTHGKIELQSPSEETKEKIEKNHFSHKRKVTRIRRSVFAAASVLVVLAGLTALDVISPIQWFTKQSTNDEQQFVIEGHEISVDVVSSAIAEHYLAGNNALSTHDLNELKVFLGFDPHLPTSLNTIFIPTNYNARIDSQAIRIGVQYRQNENASTGTPLISVRLTLFTSADEARISYEQNAEGEEVIIDGVSIYKYTNTWTSNYLWLEGHAIVQFLTSMAFDEADEYVREIIEWRGIP